MLLPSPLYPGVLIRRYQRFLADVRLDSGETLTAHCPNSGSMKGCAFPGRVLLSRSDRQGRKLAYTWELVETGGDWAGINTLLPNRIVREAIETGSIPELSGYDAIRTEVPYGENSRIDILLDGKGCRCFVEVKNVTLVEGDAALFPNSVTIRGQKHLNELMRVVREGDRGVIFYVVQRRDSTSFAPADSIDPVYGRLLRQAVGAGVEAIAYQADVTPRAISLGRPLPVILPPLHMSTK